MTSEGRRGIFRAKSEAGGFDPSLDGKRRKEFPWSQREALSDKIIGTVTKEVKMKAYLMVMLAGLCVTPAMAQSYQQVDSQVGCDSKYSDEKKQVIFDNNYKGHEFTWTGTVERVSGDDVAIKILSDTFSYDVAVKLTDENAAFNLEKGQRITLNFVLREQGGCIMHYHGDNGVIVH